MFYFTIERVLFVRSKFACGCPTFRPTIHSIVIVHDCGAVTVIWVSPCFGYPHTQIPSEMGIPGRDTQNTDSYTDKRLEETRSFCRLSPLFNTNVFIIKFGALS